jgi:hypothetical protein
MVTINITGGIGNQMFQYATARCLSIKHKKKLVLDTKLLLIRTENDTPRDFQLDYFKINADSIISKTSKIIRAIRFLSRLLLRPLSSDQQIYLFNIFLKCNLPVYLTRTFQKQKYFWEIKDILFEEFTLKGDLSVDTREIENLIKNNESVSVHIRRGDYVKYCDFFSTCSKEYYINAMSTIREKTSNPIFFIFSDDIEWVKQNIPIPYTHEYVSNKKIKDYEELVLMSKCKHNIIANSTFSWWGAWLNQNIDKIVVAPKQWFVNKTSDKLEIMPESWIQIKNI